VTQIVAAAAQQKDNLCGSFCGARILNELGFDRADGEPLDEDLIAYRAGASLPRVDSPPSLPPGAVSRTGYRYRLPLVEEDAVGTSPDGLIEAIESTSDGEVRCVPVRGPWDAGSIERLMEESGRLGARLIANLRTGRLWGGRPQAGVILGELAGEPVEDPPADWDVGHFVELEMVIRGPKRAMVVVRDTYPSLGWEGRHLQPPRVIAAALRRGDGREGGVLVIVPREKAGAAEALPARLGLVVGTWNNGCRSDASGDR
jgi:uncharacterized protein DUF6885